MAAHAKDTTPQTIALRLGQAATAVEETAIDLGTSRVYRFRRRHPVVYGLAAFILGSGFIAVFTMTTYKDWAYQSIDLKVALYQIIAGGLGGGIVAVMLAFAYTRAIRPTLPPMRAAGVIRSAEPAIAPSSPGAVTRDTRTSTQGL